MILKIPKGSFRLYAIEVILMMMMVIGWLLLAWCFQEFAVYHIISLGLALGCLVVFGLQVCLNYLRQSIEERFVAIKAVELFRTSWKQFSRYQLSQMNMQFSMGQTASELTDSMDKIARYQVQYKFYMYRALFIPLLIAMVVIALNWLCALVIILSYPLMIFSLMVIGKMTRDKTHHQIKHLSHLNAVFLDYLQGMNTLKMFRAIRSARAKVSKSSQAHLEITMRVLKVAFLSSVLIDFFTMATLALVATTLGFNLLKMMTLGQYNTSMPFFHAVAILLMVPSFFLPIRQWAALYHLKQEACAGQEVIDQYKDSVDIKPTQLHVNEPLSLTIENLSFSYPNNPLFHDLSFTLKRGQLLWIKGQSGVGKSTLLKIIMQFMRQDQGQIYINDQLLSDIARSSWHDQMAWMGHELPLLQGSLRDYFNQDGQRQWTDQQLRQAFTWTALNVEQMMGRLDIPLSEYARDLSGGQQQRLVLAKLWLKKPAIWILDEPLAHLDQVSADLLFQNVGKIKLNSMIIVVSHDQHWHDLADMVLTLGFAGRYDVHTITSHEDNPAKEVLS